MKELTIIIPNYKTPELTELCLAALKTNTDLNRVHVVGVDNQSNDRSSEILKNCPFVDFIEREVSPLESGPAMHARALDLGFTHCDTPYVMVIHTDTIFTDRGWLDFLLEPMKKEENLGGIGSWKLEFVPLWKRIGKGIEDFFRALFGRKSKKDEQKYLRSHCALYRADLIRKYTKGFDDGTTAGKSLHLMLEEANWKMRFLSSAELMKYVRHLNHATMILNPELCGGKKTASPKARRRIESELAELRKMAGLQ